MGRRAAKPEGKGSSAQGFRERFAQAAARGDRRECAVPVCGGPRRTTPELGPVGSPGRLLIRACDVRGVMF